MILGPRSPFAVVFLTILSGFSSSSTAVSADAALPTKGLYLQGGGRRQGRDGLAADPVALTLISGKWRTPKAGETIETQESPPPAWTEVEADKNGNFNVRGGYLYLEVNSDAERVVRLDLAGHGSVLVNGEPRPGDPYGNGSLHLPILLRSGVNQLLIQSAGRGPIRGTIKPLDKPAVFDLADPTLPDLIVGESENVWIGVVVLNGTNAALTDGSVVAEVNGVATETKLPPLAALTSRKVPIEVATGKGGKEGTCEVKLVIKRSGKPVDETSVKLSLVRKDQTHKRTFISKIDGSVQYYGVNPAHPLQHGRGAPAPALVLSLHGASVEGIGQARAYGAKAWGHIVAPTNRRPFGFDWEDWGRLDAIEVLEQAQARYHTDPTRTYLTGHSMGGHGTWIVGATFPDRFAAIAPSAGWISMTSYAGLRVAEPTSPLLALMRRATNQSDTLALASNYAPLGIYVLHGDADDNVPVTQARRMKEVLSKDHQDFHYYEQPKAGHWWSTPENDGTGAACVDWPPIFDLFARRVLPRNEQVSTIDFVTMNPGVSARSNWLTIEAQSKALLPSRAKLTYRPGKRLFTGTTENIARLAIDTRWIAGDEKLSIDIDGVTLKDISVPKEGTLWLAKESGSWKTVPAPSKRLKGPHRAGPFKEAFQHRMLFVYGTKGTAEENAWALAKARLDAETFYYRGNGSIEIIPDVDFELAATKDRSVILFGHEQMNAAWSQLLSDSPVQVQRGKVGVGTRTESGDDLAVLFVRPRPDSDVASVAVIAGTGMPGLRRTDRMPYFVSGVAYPDLTVLKAVPTNASDRGLVAVGFFGQDWGVETGEFAFASEAKKP